MSKIQTVKSFGTACDAIATAQALGRAEGLVCRSGGLFAATIATEGTLVIVGSSSAETYAVGLRNQCWRKPAPASGVRYATFDDIFEAATMTNIFCVCVIGGTPEEEALVERIFDDLPVILCPEQLVKPSKKAA